MTTADRTTRPPAPRETGPKPKDDLGPTTPKIERPAAPNPLKDRLNKLDKDAAKQYRQRSGQ